MQYTENSVEYDPDQCDQHGGIIVRDDDFCTSGLDVVPCKLFLTSGTLKPGRKEAQDHFHGKHGPGYDQDDGHPLHSGQNGFAFTDPVQNISDQQKKKQNRPVCKPEIMQNAHRTAPMHGSHLPDENGLY